MEEGDDGVVIGVVVGVIVALLAGGAVVTAILLTGDNSTQTTVQPFTVRF